MATSSVLPSRLLPFEQALADRDAPVLNCLASADQAGMAARVSPTVPARGRRRHADETAQGMAMIEETILGSSGIGFRKQGGNWFRQTCTQQGRFEVPLPEDSDRRLFSLTDG